MILFDSPMQTEKIAIIGFVIIIVATLAFFFFSQEAAEKVEEGDCVDINYIGKYANGTVFDSSYANPDEKANGTPIKVYVTKNNTATSPEGYEEYSAGMIEGFIDGILGLEEGKEATIGPIPPEKAYGNKIKIGDTFSTQQIMMSVTNPTNSLDITVEVTNYTSEYINLRWVNLEDFDKFTMPEGILNNLNSADQNDWVTLVPPYHIWENSTEISEIKQDSVTVMTTPTKTENLTDVIRPIQYSSITTFIFPDATTVDYDNDTITITNNPEIGKSYTYSIDYYGSEIITNITVRSIDVANDTINISASYVGYSDSLEYSDINRTISFDREYAVNRNFTDIPTYYATILFGQDLDEEGLSIHTLAGETLYFDVVVEKLYKTSES